MESSNIAWSDWKVAKCGRGLSDGISLSEYASYLTIRCFLLMFFFLNSDVVSFWLGARAMASRDFRIGSGPLAFASVWSSRIAKKRGTYLITIKGMVAAVVV